AFDRFEEGLEVAFAEASGAFALDDLEEDRRPVSDALGEDLEEVALRVAVDEDAELGEALPRQLVSERAHATASLVVVRRRHVEEANTPIAQRTDTGDDVISSQRDVLDTG